MNKERFRPFFEWIIRQKIMYARGRSWLDTIGVAAIAGSFARYGIEAAAIALICFVVVCVLIAHMEMRLKTWEYEMDYSTRLNPWFKRNDKNEKKT